MDNNHSSSIKMSQLLIELYVTRQSLNSNVKNKSIIILLRNNPCNALLHHSLFHCEKSHLPHVQFRLIY
ncbi:hypothetical protein PRUPE_7G113200 [Prunus persica]|uniref:Uncharacterized protein n=1 Tax=Prunus persica TaxID=3760 RepID=M5W439_PRUPE|nr:hypothetical protein PRUPE_7G113200 [Prunus persica]